ncbi:MAG: CsgG/HfaB family protein [Planctomycetaceae bacterium]|nr:CsgG/HfaB family protein [Planctomycetaceae bacterium]
MFKTTRVVAGVVMLGLLATLGCEEKKKELAMTADEQAALSTVTSVAVVPLTDAAGQNGSGSTVVGPVTEMVLSPGIKLVERVQLDKLVQEKDLRDLYSNSGRAAEVGKLAGVDVVIVGEVSQYEKSANPTNISIPYFGGGTTITTYRVGLGVRAVRVSDGQIIYTRTGNGSDGAGFARAAQKAAREALGPWREYFSQRQSAPKSPTPAGS